jgi:hypothetical protein
MVCMLTNSLSDFTCQKTGADSQYRASSHPGRPADNLLCHRPRNPFPFSFARNRPNLRWRRAVSGSSRSRHKREPSWRPQIREDGPDSAERLHNWMRRVSYAQTTRKLEASAFRLRQYLTTIELLGPLQYKPDGLSPRRILRLLRRGIRSSHR